MPEYFIVANSFVAPIVSDISHDYIMADTPREAMKQFIANYDHPAGLYAANLYANADVYHKDEKPLLTWRSKKAKKIVKEKK